MSYSLLNIVQFSLKIRVINSFNGTVEEVFGSKFPYFL